MVTMTSLWPLIVVAAVGLVLVIALVAGRRLFPGSRLLTRAFWCPFQEKDVEVEFEETVWEGRRLDVSRCTFFSPPTAVTCAKGCVTLVRLPPSRGREAEAEATEGGP
jgi:hypothetical protein